MNQYIDVHYSHGDTNAKTKAQYQYNRGQILRIYGITKDALPGENGVTYVHFSVRGMNKPISKEAEFFVEYGKPNSECLEVEIPSVLFTQKNPIVAYVYLSSQKTSQTIYKVEIPIIERPVPDGYDLNDEEMDDIERMILELRDATDRAEAISGLTASSETLEPGEEVTVEVTEQDKVKNIHFGIPKGKDGGYYKPLIANNGMLFWDKSNEDMPDVEWAANIIGPVGPQGAPGQTPTITTKRVENGTQVTIHTPSSSNTGMPDTSLIQIFTIPDGERGEPGVVPIIESTNGNVIDLQNSAEHAIQRMTIYGRTTQDGTPTPETPIELKNVGANGEIEVTSANKEPAIIIVAQPAAPIGVQGDIAIFKVRATGENLSYQWMYSTDGGTNYVPSTQPGNATSEMTMTIREYHNGYLYYCEITDAFGNSVKSNTVVVTVGVTTAIKLLSNPANATLPINKSAAFIAIAEGEDLRYQWQWKSLTSEWANSTQTGSNIPSMAVLVESHRNGYQYRCVITDANGNQVTTNPATLTVCEEDDIRIAKANAIVQNGLCGIPVTDEGNYTDASGQQWIADTAEYNADTGTAKRAQRVWYGRLTSTSHKWVLHSSVAGRVYPETLTPAIMVGVAPLCSHFVGNAALTQASNCVYNNDAGKVCFNTSFATLSEWKAFLDANEVYLAYVMAEPIETELSADELASFNELCTYYPNTVLYNNDNAYMSVDYIADTKRYIDEHSQFVVNLSYDSDLGSYVADKTPDEIAEAAATRKVFALMFINGTTSVNQFELINVNKSQAMFARLGTLYSTTSNTALYHTAHGYIVDSDCIAKAFTTRIASESDVPKSVVKYSEQALNDTQKLQARTNIGLSDDYINNLITAKTDASAGAVIQSKSGNIISISDSASKPIRELTIYGRTTQNGTPTPDAPVALESVGGVGIVEVNVKDGVVDGGNEHIKIITQPRNVTTPAGTNAVFHVDAAGSGLAYKWTASVDGGGTWMDSSSPGATTNMLTIAAKAYHNGYLYRCQITDANGNTVTSGVATLTIGEPTATENPVTVQIATIATPNGLPGVPVTSGGNYTDSNGQQWITDTIEYDADAGTAKQAKRTTRLTNETTFNTPYKSSTEVMWRVSPTSAVKPNVGYPVGVCSKYILAGSYEDVRENNGRIGINVNGELLIHDESLTDAAAVTAMLTSGEFELVYPRAERVETQLPAEEAAQLAALMTHHPNTTIYNDEGAQMDVEYVLETRTYIDKRTAPPPVNLLDNSNFACPINQRELTVHSGVGYTIDRWKNVTTASTLTIVEGGIEFARTSSSLSAYILQYLNETDHVYFGKTYTFAIGMMDGSIYTAVAVFPTEISTNNKKLVEVSIPNGTLSMYSRGKRGSLYVQIRANSTDNPLRIAWAAVYEGEYDADTIPSYCPKARAIEEAECERYYTRIGKTKEYSAHNYDVTKYFSKLRQTPTAKIYSEVDAVGKISVYASEGSTASEVDATLEVLGPSSVRVMCESGAGVYSYNYIELTADL